jgi:hypothetical protein
VKGGRDVGGVAGGGRHDHARSWPCSVLHGCRCRGPRTRRGRHRRRGGPAATGPSREGGGAGGDAKRWRMKQSRAAVADPTSHWQLCFCSPRGRSRRPASPSHTTAEHWSSAPLLVSRSRSREHPTPCYSICRHRDPPHAELRHRSRTTPSTTVTSLARATALDLSVGGRVGSARVRAGGAEGAERLAGRAEPTSVPWRKEGLETHALTMALGWVGNWG